MGRPKGSKNRLASKEGYHLFFSREAKYGIGCLAEMQGCPPSQMLENLFIYSLAVGDPSIEARLLQHASSTGETEKAELLLRRVAKMRELLSPVVVAGPVPGGEL